MNERLLVRGGLILLAALLATSISLAVPHCSLLDTEYCDAYCYDHYRSTCSSIVVGPCDGQSAPYELICETGERLSEYCSDCSTGGGGGGGCFLAGTMITMADGTRKAIEQIVAGDVVLAYDEATGKMKPDTVREVHDPVEWEFYLIVNDGLRLTPVHPVLSDGRWVEIGDLQTGATLTAEDGSPVKIETIRRVDEAVTVYNFAVNPYGTYVANGIIVHNKQIPAQKLPQNLP